MPTPAIIVEGLSKQYHIGARQNGRKTFREALTEAAAAPFRRLRAFGRSSHREEDTIWALKDVSFEVQPGEVVGIIGRNGAGKSTLLKILTRITEPTDGRAVLNGRVSSLLEVGTGFHLELTGRENIYLSGAVLGMKKREIDRKFDEIVDFSGVEKFIDTPVKRYSSGMTVRLGFAVAAHLEPEILLVDEVLAVGDAAFQRKCLGRMSTVATCGRTVLLVSHNMAAVDSLCRCCLLLDQGKLRASGDTGTVVSEYVSHLSVSDAEVDLAKHPGRAPGRQPIARRFRILDEAGRCVTCVNLGAPFAFEAELDSRILLPEVGLGILISSSTGQRVVTYHSRYQSAGSWALRGPATVLCRIPRCELIPGLYSIGISVTSGNDEVDRIEDFAVCEVAPRDLYGTGRIPGRQQGFYAPAAQWERGGPGIQA